MTAGHKTDRRAGLVGKATREGIVANCALKLFVSVDDLATANYVSDQLGNRTITTSTTSIRGTGFGHDRSVSKSLTGVPLMRADEVIRLPKTRSILMIANERPILTTKIRYDRDRVFRKLARAGRFGFRSVPDVPVLKEQTLALLMPAYGEAKPKEGTREPATVPGDRMPPMIAADRLPAEQPAEPAPSTKAARDGGEGAEPRVSEFRRLARAEAAPAALVVKDELCQAAGGPEPSPPETVEPVASEAVGKRGRATSRRKRHGASKATIPPNSVVRPSGRERDSLLAVFGSEAMAVLHSEARATSDGLIWIAEKL